MGWGGDARGRVRHHRHAGRRRGAWCRGVVARGRRGGGEGETGETGQGERRLTRLRESRWRWDEVEGGRGQARRSRDARIGAETLLWAMGWMPDAKIQRAIDRGSQLGATIQPPNLPTPCNATHSSPLPPVPSPFPSPGHDRSPYRCPTDRYAQLEKKNKRSTLTNKNDHHHRHNSQRRQAGNHDANECEATTTSPTTSRLACTKSNFARKKKQ